MKTFGRYLAYRLERAMSRTLVFTILSVAFTWVIVSASIGRLNAQANETGIYILAIILGIACTLIPILELADFKNRRNLDTLYFFPIKREKMALVHFLSGFIQVVIIYSVTFFSAWIHLELQTNYFALGYMFFYYIFSLLLGFVMYSIFAFLFVQGNTVADGILFCGLWVFIIMIVGWVIRAEILRNYIIDTQYWESSANMASDWGIIYSPINNLTVIFQNLIEVNKHSLEYYFRDAYAARYMSQIYMFFIWGAIGIAAAFGYFITFVKKGAEKAGEISDSWFGYRLLVPLYGYSLLIFIGDELILDIIIFALMVIGYVIYRRGFKFKTSDMIITGCGVLAFALGVML